MKKEDLAELREAVEYDLKWMVEQSMPAERDGLRAMLRYHMGWEGQGAGPEAQGKRIRPLATLLTTVAAGGEWRDGVPAASAVELLHNFSLVHDDIQDHSELRRGRSTVWVLWGVPQAINAGDVLFTLAFASLNRLSQTRDAAAALDAHQVMQQACLRLTEGQYLDISYEKELSLPLEAYWPMVGGKTATLLGACCELGALAAGAEPQRRADFRSFGYTLGLAFQVLDDCLGIWGDAATLGKSVESDLVEGKKSLPVLMGLMRQGDFYKRWMAGPISAGEAPEAARLLEADGARGAAMETADQLTRQALAYLEAAAPDANAAQPLRDMADALLKRDR